MKNLTQPGPNEITERNNRDASLTQHFFNIRDSTRTIRSSLYPLAKRINGLGIGLVAMKDLTLIVCAKWI